MSTSATKRPVLRVLPWLALPVLAALAFGLLRGRAADGGDAALPGALVQRGPLKLEIVARGDLSAADAAELRSEVEGRTTILTLVPEGTRVQAGDLVCELDATALNERRFQQSIAVRNAEAAYVKAKQNHQIQLSQNKSDLAKSKQKEAFARLDYDKFVEGERDSQLEKARQAIELAKEDATRARTKLEWSNKLAEKGFLTQSELETDRIANHRADVLLQQAQRDLALLEKYQLPRRETELRAAKEEALFERERVEMQAAARIVDFEADLATNEAKLGLEREKLAKLEAQIAKARMHAPCAGMVVYAQLDSDEPPIQEGAEVRERQLILSIPNASGMKAQAKLHESVLDQVSIGLPCTISVDALAGRRFSGRLAFIALLPDQNSRWSNPNSRLYRADISIADASEDMRPGMSCSIRVLVEELPDVLYVPAQAVFREGDRTLCYVATGAGRGGRFDARYEVRPVAVGRYNVEHVQVLSGLAEGERVLLSRPEDRPAPGSPPKDESKAGAKPGGDAPAKDALPPAETAEPRSARAPATAPKSG